MLLFKLELLPKMLSRAEAFLPAADMAKLRRRSLPQNLFLSVDKMSHDRRVDPCREVFRTPLTRRQHLGGRPFQASELQKQGPVLDVSALAYLEIFFSGRGSWLISAFSGQIPAESTDLAWLGLLSANGNTTCLFLAAGLTD